MASTALAPAPTLGVRLSGSSSGRPCAGVCTNDPCRTGNGKAPAPRREDFVLAVCAYSVAMLAALSACALSNTLSHARAALTMPLYWPLASIAAWRAFLELLFRPHHWSMTTHGVSQRRQAPAARTDAPNQRRDASRFAIASTSPSL
jgi:hypothetical protein